ncbi:MAG: hypothetical protein U1B83_10225, partial [Candidatus Cloacimonadaceae bacterium]|nr:hypothetical protein [Candidatus Cloacimonadaceae bacterium]
LELRIFPDLDGGKIGVHIHVDDLFHGFTACDEGGIVKLFLFLRAFYLDINTQSADLSNLM